MCVTTQPSSTVHMISSLAHAELWVAVVVVAIPTALACATAIVLLLAVERRDRVQAIRALPPLVHALARHAGGQGIRHAHAACARLARGRWVGSRQP